MKYNECIFNIDCLIFLFNNDNYFQRILSSWKMAGQYIKENKRYFFNYKSKTSKINKRFTNREFANMFTRPCPYMQEFYGCCDPTAVIIEKKQYELDNICQDYLKNYGMGYYYVNKIIRQIEVLQNNIQFAKNNEPIIKYANEDCKIGDITAYQKLYNVYKCGFNTNYLDSNFMNGKELEYKYLTGTGDFFSKIGKTVIINFINKGEWRAYFTSDPGNNFYGKYTFKYDNIIGKTTIYIKHIGKSADGNENILELDGWVDDYKNIGNFTETGKANDDKATGTYQWIEKKCLNISERGCVTITIPPTYFPNLKISEIKKKYNIYDLLQIYRLNVNKNL